MFDLTYTLTVRLWKVYTIHADDDDQAREAAERVLDHEENGLADADAECCVSEPELVALSSAGEAVDL